jgi:hypothetical protein
MVSKDSYEGDTCVKEKAEEKRGRLRFVTLFYNGVSKCQIILSKKWTGNKERGKS